MSHLPINIGLQTDWPTKLQHPLVLAFGYDRTWSAMQIKMLELHFPLYITPCGYCKSEFFWHIYSTTVHSGWLCTYNEKKKYLI